LASQKLKIESEDKIYINERVEIHEHAGQIFKNLRKQDNIESEDIIKSLHPIFNREAIKGAGESQGKSGSFFFFSHDRKFIIKTMSDGELKTFKHMFEDFVEYLTKKNPDSLLARLYGIFTVYMEDIVPIHLILMGNTIQCVNKNEKQEPTKSIQCIFDLKGSLHGRITKGKNLKNTSIMKDRNIMQYNYKTVRRHWIFANNNVIVLAFQERRQTQD
jgi:hypothetical protein